MKDEEHIVQAIIEIETYYDDQAPDDYLDEGAQSRLGTLYELLDRPLTIDELKTRAKARKEYFGWI